MIPLGSYFDLHPKLKLRARGWFSRLKKNKKHLADFDPLKFKSVCKISARLLLEQGCFQVPDQ